MVLCNRETTITCAPLYQFKMNLILGYIFSNNREPKISILFPFPGFAPIYSAQKLCLFYVLAVLAHTFRTGT